MGIHVGWRVTPHGNQWRGWAWDPATKSYRTKVHRERKEAATWARSLAAGVALGRPDPAMAPATRSTATIAVDYLANLRARGRSEAHLDLVRRTLESASEAVPDLSAAGAGVAVERWRDALTCAPGTKNRKLIELRGMIRWALRREMISRDPTAIIDRVREDDVLRPQFSVEELRKIVQQSHFKRVRNGRRRGDPWHLRCCLLLYAGLRYQEAAHLRWQDVDFASKTIRVSLASGARVKRRKERELPLQSELADLLLPLRQPEGRILPDRPGSPTRGFRAFLHRCGLPIDGRSPHSFRHSYAGILSATGVAQSVAGDHLGHSAPATTARYAKLSARYVSAVAGWPRGEIRLITDRRMSPE